MLLLFPIIFGFIGMALATNKGYSAVLGFALGFLGSILGIIVVAVLPDRSSKPAPRRRAKRKTKAKTRKSGDAPKPTSKSKAKAKAKVKR